MARSFDKVRIFKNISILHFHGKLFTILLLGAELKMTFQIFELVRKTFIQQSEAHNTVKVGAPGAGGAENFV